MTPTVVPKWVTDPRQRTYSLTHMGQFSMLCLRFVVIDDHVTIHLESTDPRNRSVGYGCPIHGFPDQPPFSVHTDEPLRGIGIGRARFLWDMLVIHRGWRQLIHTP